MKNLLQTLILAGALAAATASAAVANEHPLSREQQRAVQSVNYWNKGADASQATSSRASSDAAAQQQKVSQYPCANCVYDSQLGGYVRKTYGKN